MTKYFVVWGNQEEECKEIKKAISLAEEKATPEKSASVWVEKNGIREEEPFFHCEWTI